MARPSKTGHPPRSRRRAPTWMLVAAAAAAGGLTACGPGADEIDCHDLLPRNEVRYAALATLITTPGPKACSPCHNTRTPVAGYDFEAPGITYDALTTKADIVYGQVASGRMPKTGVAWDESDLQLLRSWYCYGAPYDH